jgi:demethoxyubiquinone hydroxylase (CLK1/Coq7/Cat5 family)
MRKNNDNKKYSGSENESMVLENTVLKRDEATRGLRKVHRNKGHKLHSKPHNTLVRVMNQCGEMGAQCRLHGGDVTCVKSVCRNVEMCSSLYDVSFNA